MGKLIHYPVELKKKFEQQISVYDVQRKLEERDRKVRNGEFNELIVIDYLTIIK